MMFENMLTVDVKAYLDDLYENLSEDKRQEFARLIVEHFDYSAIYDRLDEEVFYLCNLNNINIEDWIMDRQELQAQFVQQLLDDMDMKTLMCVCYDYMMDSYDKYSEAELLSEVEEYYPEMLEDNNWILLQFLIFQLL